MSKSLETQHPNKAFGWAARDTSGVLSPFHFSRRENGVDDVTIKILYCGICHSDLHTLKNEWGNTIYPAIPGHEIVGIATEVGGNVEGFEVGDSVGVGCMVGSCRSCDSCNKGLENYCPNVIYTYCSIDGDGTPTYGGYSNMIVVDKRFLIKFPKNLPLDAGAPLLCAGITVYSPMRYYGLAKPGLHLGVVGLGGLGHVAVKFGKAFGMKVTVISTSPSKKEEAMDRLGADSFLVSKDPQQMQAAFGTFDGILDTVSAAHPLPPLLSLLKSDGKLVMVGAPVKPFELQVGYVHRTNSTMPGYYDGRYWTLWKLPMFGCVDSSQVLSEIHECKKTYPNAYIRCLAFNNKKQVQCMAFLIQTPSKA